MVINERVKLISLSEENKKLLGEQTQKQVACVNYWVDIIKKKESTKLRDLSGKSYFQARKIFSLQFFVLQPL